MVKSLDSYNLPTLEDLLEAGVHFGHQTRRWHPKVAPFLYKEQNKIHIFDLLKTHEKLRQACDFLFNLASLGKTVCFVGTKKQAADIIRKEATRAGALFVSERWTGGMITNFDHVRNKMLRLKNIEQGLAPGGMFEKYTKKERLDLERDAQKLEQEVGGVRNMDRVPDALFVVDTKKEFTAVLEARKRGVPVVALVDSNCDPTKIDHPIPGNDDATQSLAVITKAVADAVEAGYKAWANEKAKPEGVKSVEHKAVKKEIREEIAKEDEVKKVNKKVEKAKIIKKPKTTIKSARPGKKVGRPKKAK
jgi:small subunit ribosomal protein S2